MLIITLVLQFGDENVSVILVGNKSDREDSRVISSVSGEEVRIRLNEQYFVFITYNGVYQIVFVMDSTGQYLNHFFENFTQYPQVGIQ